MEELQISSTPTEPKDQSGNVFFQEPDQDQTRPASVESTNEIDATYVKSYEIDGTSVKSASHIFRLTHASFFSTSRNHPRSKNWVGSNS